MKTVSRLNLVLAELEAQQADPEAYTLLLDLDRMNELSPRTNRKN